MHDPILQESLSEWDCVLALGGFTLKAVQHVLNIEGYVPWMLARCIIVVLSVASKILLLPRC